MPRRSLFALCAAAVGIAMALSACSSEDAADAIPPQHWNGYSVQLQTHPAPVVRGMDEFIVIVNRGTSKEPAPSENLIVSLRIDDGESWKQMIQDGYIGVYRRAVRVDDPLHQIINVQLQKGDDVGYLRFPLIAPPPTNKTAGND